MILLAYDVHPEYRLILAANRDEFYDRPALPMAFWEDHPDILAGRDLKGGGTWLGISRSGRFSAITNYREPGGPKPDAPSRGHLVSAFLSGDSSSQTYFEGVSDCRPELQWIQPDRRGCIRSVLLFQSGARNPPASPRMVRPEQPSA